MMSAPSSSSSSSSCSTSASSSSVDNISEQIASIQQALTTLLYLPSAQLLSSLNLLLLIITNITNSPDDDKYRRINRLKIERKMRTTHALPILKLIGFNTQSSTPASSSSSPSPSTSPIDYYILPSASSSTLRLLRGVAAGIKTMVQRVEKRQFALPQIVNHNKFECIYAKSLHPLSLYFPVQFSLFSIPFSSVLQCYLMQKCKFFGCHSAVAKIMTCSDPRDHAVIAASHSLVVSASRRVEWSGKRDAIMRLCLAARFAERNAELLEYAGDIRVVDAGKHWGLHRKKLGHEGDNKAVAVDDDDLDSDSDAILSSSTETGGAQHELADYEGDNRLGKLMMEIRDELIKKKTTMK